MMLQTPLVQVLGIVGARVVRRGTFNERKIEPGIPPA